MTNDASLRERFRVTMRLAAASVSLVTARDGAGAPHGMAVTSATSLSMEPPAMMLAVNRAASIHPVIVASGHFCLNLMGTHHAGILERFSRSELRETRFASDDWDRGLHSLPVLRAALTAHLCTVEAMHDHGTHSVFFGRVDEVILPETGAAPLVWLNGALAPLGQQPPRHD